MLGSAGLFVQNAFARQKVHKIAIPVKENVAWWSGVVNHGEKMPIKNGYHADFESNYGNQGFERINDQFLLGDKILVAPVIEIGATKRTVVLPKGRRKNQDGKVFKGGRSVEVDVTLGSLPYFSLVERGK